MIRRLVLAAALGAVCQQSATAQAEPTMKAKHDDVIACRDKEMLEPLLDAELAGDRETFTKVMARLLMVSVVMPNECVTFKSRERAHVYDIDFFGSWIVVAKSGRTGRWHSFKSWWD